MGRDVILAVSVEALKTQLCMSWDFCTHFAVKSATSSSSQSRSQRGSLFLYLYSHGWFALPHMSDCHSLNRHAKWKVFNCRRWEWKSWSRPITQWYVRKSQQNLWFLKDQCIFKLLVFYTSQPRLADCWQLHDIFAVTWLESETSDKFLVWMSLCDMQWQIYFCYYKYVACPMVGILVLFLVWPWVICLLSLCFCFTIQEKMEKMTRSSFAVMAHSFSAMLEPDTGLYRFHWVQ